MYQLTVWVYVSLASEILKQKNNKFVQTKQKEILHNKEKIMVTKMRRDKQQWLLVTGEYYVDHVGNGGQFECVHVWCVWVKSK